MKSRRFAALIAAISHRRLSRRAKALLILGMVSMVPGIVAACTSNSPTREVVGSSVNAVVSANTAWPGTNTTIPINNVWNTQTAAGHYDVINGANDTMRQITLFEGNFDGGLGVGYMTRDEDTAPNSPVPATTSTSSFGAPTLAGGGAAAGYIGPAAIAYLDKDGDGSATEGQWLIATQATNANGADIVFAITNNGAQGSSPWTSYSMTRLVGSGDGPALNPVGAIVLAIDPSLTNYSASEYIGAVGAPTTPSSSTLRMPTLQTLGPGAQTEGRLTSLKQSTSSS
jgi:hypothetical protein